MIEKNPLKENEMKVTIHNAQFSHHIGGTERLIYEQIKNLLDYKDVQITLVTTKTKNKSQLYKEIERLKNKNLKVFTFDGSESLGIQNIFDSNNPCRWHFESFTFGLQTQEFYKEHKSDLVVTYFSTDSLFISRNFLNVFHFHGFPLEASELGELSLNRPDFFISISNYIKYKWVELYPFLKSKDIKVIYPGIDTSKFKSFDLNKSVDIIFVGRLIKIKGIDDLLEALKKIETSLKVILVGDGPEKSAINKMIKEIKGHNISLLSNVHEEELIKLYNQSKIGIFPSYAKEGVILTMLEAASCGCSIITTNSCSMPEFIKDNVNGLLAEPKNPEDLARKIRFLLQNESVMRELGKNAREEILLEWDTKERVKQLYNCYKGFVK